MAVFSTEAHSPNLYLACFLHSLSLTSMFLAYLFFVQVGYLAYQYILVFPLPRHYFLATSCTPFSCCCVWSCIIVSLPHICWHTSIDRYSALPLCAPAVATFPHLCCKVADTIQALGVHQNMHNERVACWEQKKCMPGLAVAWARRQEIELLLYCGHTLSSFLRCLLCTDRTILLQPRISLKFMCANLCQVLSNRNS